METLTPGTGFGREHEGGNIPGHESARSMTRTVLVTEKETLVLAVAQQGPPGAAGPQGPPGEARLVQVGAAPISGHSAVAVNAAGLLVPADATVASHLGAVVGLLPRAYSPGENAEVQVDRVLEHAGWNWTHGPVLVGAAGALVQSAVPGALFSQVVGFAISPTKILVGIYPPITIA